MKITKLEHSGLIIEKDEQKLIFDPVEFAETLPTMTNVVAIIITHIHSDHLQPEIITRILRDNPNARVFAPGDFELEIPNLTLVTGEDEIEVGSFHLQFFGKDHAAVFADQIPCRNIGTVVNGTILNPGDSFDLFGPAKRVPVLLVPEVAPWAKISESIEYVEKVKPEYAIPVHDGLLSKMGKNIYDNLLKNTCEKVGTKFLALSPNDSFEIDG